MYNHACRSISMSHNIHIWTNGNIIHNIWLTKVFGSLNYTQHYDNHRE